jgi:type II secretory pathway component PulF
MGLSTYRGRNARGEAMSGSTEAACTEGVLSWMRASGISPIQIQLKNDPLNNQPFGLRALQEAEKSSATDLLQFTRLRPPHAPENQKCAALPDVRDGTMTVALMTMTLSVIPVFSQVYSSMSSPPLSCK